MMPFTAPSKGAYDGSGSVPDLIAGLAGRSPDSVAITAPGLQPLTHGALVGQVQRVAIRLAASGIGPGDCVAVLLPNGPELAAAFLSVASVATCAPRTPPISRTSSPLTWTTSGPGPWSSRRASSPRRSRWRVREGSRSWRSAPTARPRPGVSRSTGGSPADRGMGHDSPRRRTCRAGAAHLGHDLAAEDRAAAAAQPRRLGPATSATHART